MRTLLAATVLIAMVLSCSADLAGEYQAASALVKDGKLSEAAPGLSRVVAMAAERDDLSASELMQVGMAHSLLMANYFAQALQKQDITDEQRDRATYLMNVALGREDIRVVAHGSPINLEALLIPGKTNLVDFFSLYCGPCVSLGAYIDKVTELRDDIVLIKVDINRPGHKGIDWGSPAAKQFGLQSIPHLRVYGPDGQLQAEGDAARTWIIEQIQAAGL